MERELREAVSAEEALVERALAAVRKLAEAVSTEGPLGEQLDLQARRAPPPSPAHPSPPHPTPPHPGISSALPSAMTSRVFPCTR